MRSIFLYLLFCVVILSSCEKQPHKVKRLIARKTVFMIKDTLVAPRIKVRPLNKDTSYIEFIFKTYDLVDIRTMDSTIKVDLRYADTNNFLGRNLYDGLRRAYFTCETALRLCNAQQYLRSTHPGLSLIIFDASRPQHIQQMMWDSLKLPPLTKFSYLSKPEETSLHNYGCAADVSIVDLKTGEELDMGTEYDSFQKLSQPVYEYQFLKSGELSREAYQNRKLLRMIMKQAKMNAINSEWWHFSSCSREEAIARYRLIR